MIRIRTLDDLWFLKPSPDVVEVYIGRRLSKKLAATLLSLYPNLRRIYMPSSLVETLSPRLKGALSSVGVEVVPTNRRPGRPRKYDKETLKLIKEKYKSGERPSKISSDLGIPLRTVYYLLRKLGLRDSSRER